MLGSCEVGARRGGTDDSLWAAVQGGLRAVRALQGAEAASPLSHVVVDAIAGEVHERVEEKHDRDARTRVAS